MKQIRWKEDSLEGVARSLDVLESDLSPHAMRLRHVMLQAAMTHTPAGVGDELARMAARVDRIAEEAGRLAAQTRAVNARFAQEDQRNTALFRPHTALDPLRQAAHIAAGFLDDADAEPALPPFPSVLPLPELPYTLRDEIILPSLEELF